MNIRKNKICFITGSRAEYGLLKRLMKEISHSSIFSLQIIVTGSHLSKIHGNTKEEIKKDGFVIDEELEIDLNQDTDLSTCEFLSKVISKASDTFNRITPDLIVLLGDRYELLGAASAAMIHRIPIAHIHGGETTEGAFDEGIRHAITKLSHLHFVATESYRKRVIQLGEHPSTVFNVGGLGVDAIKNINLLNKEELQKELGINFLKKNILITYHPLTLASKEEKEYEFLELIKALSRLEDTLQIFTMPNADPGNFRIREIINSYLDKNELAIAYTSLGQMRYFSFLSNVDAVVGNSSSGILEAPSFNIATINIGNRQKGRLMAKSVINVPGDAESILRSISMIYTNEFHQLLKENYNPYGEGDAVVKILSILNSLDIKSLLMKKFFDIDFNP